MAFLAAGVHCLKLNKATVRAALFPRPVLDYSAEQDEISMEAIYHAAASILNVSLRRAVILDGRTFLPAKQVDDLLPARTLSRVIRLCLRFGVSPVFMPKEESQLNGSSENFNWRRAAGKANRVVKASSNFLESRKWPN
jgi:hypothetical protein